MGRQVFRCINEDCFERWTKTTLYHKHFCYYYFGWLYDNDDTRWMMIIDDGPLTADWDSPRTDCCLFRDREIHSGRPRRRISASFFVGFPNKQISIRCVHLSISSSTHSALSVAWSQMWLFRTVCIHISERRAIPFHIARKLIDTFLLSKTHSPLNVNRNP